MKTNIQYLCPMILVLSLFSNAYGDESIFSHRDLVNAMRDAYPEMSFRIRGNTCDGVYPIGNSRNFVIQEEECKAVMSAWPARKAQLQAEQIAKDENRNSQRRELKNMLKQKLQLTDQDFNLLREILFERN